MLILSNFTVKLLNCSKLRLTSQYLVAIISLQSGIFVSKLFIQAIGPSKKLIRAFTLRRLESYYVSYIRRRIGMGSALLILRDLSILWNFFFIFEYYPIFLGCFLKHFPFTINFVKLLIFFLLRSFQILIQFSKSFIREVVFFLASLLYFRLLPNIFIIKSFSCWLKSWMLIWYLLIILKLPVFDMNILNFVFKINKLVLKRAKLVL